MDVAFFVVIRGPLGVGKSSVAARLANAIRARHILIDDILVEHGFDEWEDGYMSQRSFLQANEVAANRAHGLLAQGIAVIFDGNFYWESQIKDLAERLDYRSYVFTLKAPLEVCIRRDSQRETSYGADAAKAVFAKSTSFDWGVGIDATRPIDAAVREIRSHFP